MELNDGNAVAQAPVANETPVVEEKETTYDGLTKQDLWNKSGYGKGQEVLIKTVGDAAVESYRITLIDVGANGIGEIAFRYMNTRSQNVAPEPMSLSRLKEREVADVMKFVF